MKVDDGIMWYCEAHLVLVAKRALDAMGVKVAPSYDVHQSNGLSAFYRGAHFTDRFLAAFPDLPQALRRSGVGDGRHELLSAP